MTIVVVLLGALFGAGLVAFVYGVRPPQPTLAEALAAPGRPAMQPDPGSRGSSEEEWATRLGRRAVPLVRALGFPTSSLRADLAVVEADVERHLAGKATCAVAGALTPWGVSALATFGAGVPTGWWMPTLASLVLGAALFFAPDLAVRHQAAERRGEMRQALALVLDLTVIALAGGAGIQQALADAAAGPFGWAASRIRSALTIAKITRTSPWPHLGDLGRELDVPDLAELAATLTLAGTEGAKVRASLAAKARAMRRRGLSEADGAAQAATEQMAVPVVVLFAAFLTFIGYPALAQVLNAT
ncbi:type II secretion system F family protein [Streptomyces sp. N35]|uniref:type II secretion system F family protein n=1 Tax=Streptomyces sp. N35 TaxID=2795730 RepID=UPI001F215827|nr:type II secretion system F family protein [Streptomyces sp. N35]